MCPAVSYSSAILMLISTYKTPVSKPGLDPAGLVVFFFHDRSESVWCIRLFKLFTQRKEMERKLRELHESETLG